jgi:hypothetical protein
VIKDASELRYELSAGDTVGLWLDRHCSRISVPKRNCSCFLAFHTARALYSFKTNIFHSLVRFKLVLLKLFNTHNTRDSETVFAVLVNGIKLTIIRVPNVLNLLHTDQVALIVEGCGPRLVDLHLCNVTFGLLPDSLVLVLPDILQLPSYNKHVQLTWGTHPKIFRILESNQELWALATPWSPSQQRKFN